VDLIENIGAFLGIAAFVGLAILAFLYFSQARDLRRLREWAGGAPERARSAAEQAAAARGEPPPEVSGPTRVERAWGRVRAGLSAIGNRLVAAWQAGDRRSPVDLRIVAATLLVAGVAAGALLTDGFGLLGEKGGSARGGKGGAPPRENIEVAVLNGTTTNVPGLASQVGEDVKGSGYKLGEVADTQIDYQDSVVMYIPDHEPEAEVVANDLRKDLGSMGTEKMTSDVRPRARGANVAVIVGQDNADL
jgi:hypothetical protein